MKKEYVTPEMENFEFEIPTLLQTEGEGGSIGTGEGKPGEGGD